MRPLDGITVVAIDQAVAAPLATRNLADLGADVIKIERVDGGDFARAYDHVVNGLASHFVWLNRGKRSVAVDLKAPAGRELVTSLIAGADVFLQNLAPGAAERLGLDAAGLRADHPELIVVDMSGYGHGGPFESKLAYDMLVQCESGLASITGTPEAACKTGIPTSDIAAGMYAQQAVLAALFRRERGGGGASIEVTMFESTVEWMGHPMHSCLATGKQPPRSGLSHPVIAPYDAYPCADGSAVLIGIQNDRGWRRLAEGIMGTPQLADHPDYAANVDRCINRAALDELIAAATRRYTSEELIQALDAAGIASARLNDIPAMIAHPQLAARRRWRSVATENGEIPALLPPSTFDDHEAVMGAVPALGQHTAQVLTELGYDDATRIRWQEQGVIGCWDGQAKPDTMTAPRQA